MSGKATGWARERLREGAVSGGPTARLVLLLMADYADREHALWPSISTLAEEAGSERAVQRAIASLETDGLISREARTSANGKTASTRYTLAVETWIDAQRAEGCQNDTPRGVNPAPSGVSDWRGEGVNLTPSTTLEPPTLTDESSDELSEIERGARALEEAGSPGFEGLPGDKARRAEADRLEAAYLRLAAIWVEALAGRVHDRNARRALSAAAAEGVDPDLVVDCAPRFLADAKASRDRPMLHNWIAGKRWYGFEPKPGSAIGSAGAAADAPTFDGPPELVSRVFAIKGRDWFASYLAQCGWDEGGRAIVAPRQFTADRIAADLRGLLAELKITVIVRKAAA